MSEDLIRQETTQAATHGDADTLKKELTRLRAEINVAQQRLHLILEAAGATCGWDWDIVQRKLTGDAYFAAVTGQDAVDLAKGVPAESFFTAIHPDDVKRIRLGVAGIMAGAEIFSKEYRLLKEDGGFRWVHAKGRAVFDADDQPIRFFGNLVDITEQKRAQEQLRIAQVAGGIGTFEHISGYSTVTVSAQFCRLFGLHPTKVLPVSTLNRLIHPDDSPIIDLSVPDGPQDESNAEFRITRADDKTERWLARRGEYVDDPDAHGRRYIGVIYDITVAKQNQERLREANRALSKRVRERTRERNRMWQSSRDLLVVMGADGVFRDVNPAWVKVFGSPSSDVIGGSFYDTVWPEDRETVAVNFAQAETLAHVDLSVRHTHPDGSILWVSWVISREDTIIYAYGRDVTAEKEQGEILRETEAQLRQSQKMEAVGQLTGGIAHDFNNMLTGVIGALGIIRRRIAAGRYDDLDKFIEAATGSAHRAAALTHRLLAFSRRQPLDRQSLDMGKLITSVEDLLRRTLGEQIELAAHVDPETLPALTDPNQLENAVLNLAINARDAMPDGGKLTIETTNAVFTQADVLRNEGVKPGNYVVLAVSDTGVGMSKDTIEKAFDPFFTTKPIGQGTGLGLSMIYGFAQQSGGYVRIYSEVGRGTTVKLFLPAGMTESADETDNDGKLVQPMGYGETVLVVEDDSSVRLLVVDVLKELGYNVLEAFDSTSALPIIESKRRIDLLVSDVGLPGLNGRQLAEIAIKERAGLKVLFITGYAATAASRADFLAPGMDMITKPFAIDDLARKVREILTG
ncbi:MAG: PAS domain-containing protein [Rhizobiaceae bacterium]|nr:PAS domain-containing protein [Rhizobiaceae bacterium]